MPQSPIRDSLNRCDPSLYANPYDVKNHWDFKPNAVSAPSVPKDTIEAYHDRLKQEALQRLRHTSKYTIIQTGFMRVGKFLFLAIALPPYLVLYGIPKWILVEALPSLVSVCVWMGQKVKQKVAKGSQAVSKVCIRFFQFIQNQVNALIQPIIQLGLDIKNALQRIRANVAHFFKRFAAIVKKPFSFKRPHFGISNSFKNVAKRLSQMKGWIGNQLSKEITLLMQPIYEGINWFKRINNTLVRKTGAFSSRIKINIRVIPKQFGLRFQTSKHLAQTATTWLVKQFGLYGDDLKNLAKLIGQGYRQGLRPIAQRIGQVIKSRKDRIVNFFKEKKEKGSNWLKNKFAKVKSLKNREVIERLFPERLYRWLPISWRNVLKKIFFNFVIRGALRLVGRTIYYGVVYSYKGIKMAWSLIPKTFSLIRKVISGSWYYAKQLLLQGFYVIGKAFGLIGYVMTRGIYHLFVSLIMLAILFRWGLHLLRNFTRLFLFGLGNKKRQTQAIQ